VDRSVIANYEQGNAFPPVPVLRRIALALGASVDQLIFDDPSPASKVQDRGLLDVLAKIDMLDYHTKDIIKELVEGLLAKQELERLRQRLPPH
jgi:transcriptional regulator with XRE-family HTH domain